jgi:hypothetical protein
VKCPCLHSTPLCLYGHAQRPCRTLSFVEQPETHEIPVTVQCVRYQQCMRCAQVPDCSAGFDSRSGVAMIRKAMSPCAERCDM